MTSGPYRIIVSYLPDRTKRAEWAKDFEDKMNALYADGLRLHPGGFHPDGDVLWAVMREPPS